MAADDFGFSWDDDAQNRLQQRKTPENGGFIPPPTGDAAGMDTSVQNLFGDVQASSVNNPASDLSAASSNLTDMIGQVKKTPQTDWGTPQTGAPNGDVGSDFGSFSYQPSSPAPGVPPGAQTMATTMAPYQDTVAKLQQTTDPQQKAVLQDQLARDVFAQLKTAGHDVKWDGDQLIIDGRPYVVAGGSAGSPEPGGVTGGAGAQAARTENGLPDSSNWNTKGYAAPQYVAQNPGQAPGGWDPAKWNDPNYQDPKYVFGRIEMEDSGGDGLFQTPEERNRVVSDILKAYPGATFDGKQYIQLPDGGAPIDIFRGANAGIYGMAFEPSIPDAGSGGSAMPSGMGAQGAAGVELGSPSYAQPTPQGTLSGQPPSLSAATTAPGQFKTTGQTYTPGTIGTEDIPNFSYDDLMKQLGNLGPNDASTDQLVSNILAHPESVDAHTLDTMKAKSKDELAEIGQLNDENLTGQGYQLGISDSPWLQSERNAGTRDRQSALVKSNRDLELSAAQTNTADKRAAAELGSSYLNAKAGRNTAATALAADTTLRAASLRGDRMALRESINQKAAELGQSADKMQLDYTMGLLDDATRRYGIDVGASIDRAKLAQAGREYQEDLAFKITALQQADDQFAAEYGLNVEKQRHSEDQDAWDRYATTFGD